MARIGSAAGGGKTGLLFFASHLKKRRRGARANVLPWTRPSKVLSRSFASSSRRVFLRPFFFLLFFFFSLLFSLLPRVGNVSCRVAAPSSSSRPLKVWTGAVKYSLAFNTPVESFECEAVRLSLVAAMNSMVPSSALHFTKLDSEPATTATMECVEDSVNCPPAVKRLFDLIGNGQIDLTYPVIFGTDPAGRTVRNPKPVFTFPIWAIGLIIGGAVAVGMLILLLCIVCTRKKQRRKRRPLKSPLYVPLTESGAGVGGGEAKEFFFCLSAWPCVPILTGVFFLRRGSG